MRDKSDSPMPIAMATESTRSRVMTFWSTMIRRETISYRLTYQAGKAMIIDKDMDTSPSAAYYTTSSEQRYIRGGVDDVGRWARRD